MASDPSATPISLDEIRTAVEGLSGSNNRADLERLKEQVQSLITDLQGKAVAIARRIEELISSVIPDSRRTSFETIKTNSTGRRQTLSNLQTTLLRLKNLVESADATRADLTVQIAALTERLNELPNVDTERGQLEVLKDIFKFQWAELAVANNLLSEINSKNKPSLYNEEFQQLVREYLDVIGTNTGVSFNESDGIPTSAGDDRLASFKTNNRARLGVNDADLDYNWTTGVDVAPSPEELTAWEADVPSGSAADVDLEERRTRLVGEAQGILARITNPSELNDTQRSAFFSLRDNTGRLSIAAPGTYENIALDRLQTAIDRFKREMGYAGGKRRKSRKQSRGKLRK